MNDLISRQAAIRWVKTECNPYGKPTLDFESGKKVIEHLEQMPSAQPEHEEFEWCTDCKEYDHERQCCPKWTKVIRNTVTELKQPQWIPCSERLPKHDETVLVWYRGETRIGYLTDISETDFSENDVWVLHGSFPFKHDEKKVVAWMPLPEPYEVEK
jgi:hypothetical protein